MRSRRFRALLTWKWQSRNLSRQLHLVDKALSHFIYRHRSRGFNTWHEYKVAARRRRNLQMKSLRHLLNSSLSRGFNAWYDLVVIRTEAMRLMRKGLAFMVNSKLALGYGSWLSAHAGSGSASRMERALRHQEPRALPRVAGMAAPGGESRLADGGDAARPPAMLNRRLSGGFNGWVELGDIGRSSPAAAPGLRYHQPHRNRDDAVEQPRRGRRPRRARGAHQNRELSGWNAWAEIAGPRAEARAMSAG